MVSCATSHSVLAALPQTHAALSQQLLRLASGATTLSDEAHIGRCASEPPEPRVSFLSDFREVEGEDALHPECRSKLLNEPKWRLCAAEALGRTPRLHYFVPK
eukprot:1105921-Pleurochrysis_carterae.AAC.2